jgi:hypothetical protein
MAAVDGLRIIFHAQSDNIEEKRPLSGEASLWAAVLGQVLLDLDFTGHDSKRIQSNARQWLSSSNAGIGSLRWIADFLDLSPSAVRKAALGRSVESAQFVRRRTVWSKPSGRAAKADASQIASGFSPAARPVVSAPPCDR